MPNLLNKNLMRFYVVTGLVFCLLAHPAMARKTADKSDLAYSQLEKETKTFERDKKAQRFRHNFEKMASKWENFAKTHASSAKASNALVKAAELYEKNAAISRNSTDYERAADSFLKAVAKTAAMSTRDNLLVRAARIFEDQLGDKSKAAEVLAPYVKILKTKQKQKLPKSAALYAEVKSKIKPLPVAKAATKTTMRPVIDAKPELQVIPAPVVAKTEPQGQIEKIEKVELLGKDEAVGLRFTTSGNLEIKQGVIAKSADAPRRVYFDFSRSELGPLVPPSFEIMKKGINQVRFGQFKEDVVRVVVEAEASMPFHVKADKNPIEIWFGKNLHVPKEELKVADSAPKVAEAPTGLSLRKIVIDPGHGGSDPGAIGRSGLQEKDVTLAIAKRLKKALELQMPGLRVFLTRDHDKYVSLPERTAFANNLNADLFISVHVNASPNRKTQGIETYYLNISHDRYAVRLASRENAMSETEISNLEFILADLAMKSNVSDSVRLGREVQSSVFGHMQGSWDDIKDLGLKHALFYVLLGARMPAVLVETAFISNHEDEKRLRTDSYQDAIVEGMVKGIRRYSEQKQAMYQP